MILEGKKLLTIDWDNENDQKEKKNVSAIKLKNLVRKNNFLLSLNLQFEWKKLIDSFKNTLFALFCLLSVFCYGIFDGEKKKNFKKEIRISEFEMRTQADLWIVEKN